MRPHRPVIAALAAGAALLLVGRAFAFLYSEAMWYSSLGASSLWRERVVDTLLVNGVCFFGAAAFAFANLSAVRHSILSLVLPRRIANVEFGEAVSERRLDALAIGIAIVLAFLAAPAVPSWTRMALVRANVRFAELDPYHELDLSYYTTWLPLELDLHSWAWIVVLVVTGTVIALYALTPGLRLRDGVVRMSAYVRRHLALLAGAMLLMLAWRARLRSYTLLFDGSGPDGTFTAVDHRWLLPAYVLLGLAIVAAAVLFVSSSWSRQRGLSLAALSGALAAWLGVMHVLPLLLGTPAPALGFSRSDAPYAATREAFTRRAFDLGPDGTPRQRETPGAMLTRSTDVANAARLAVIAPGARGYLVARGSPPIAAPGLSSVLSRLAHAWQEQDVRLLGRNLPPEPRIIRVRDVATRVRRLAPVFEQGVTGALFHADTLYWVTDLYFSSATYPLSRRYTVAGARRGYYRHAATAYVNGASGSVTIVADRVPEPVTFAWSKRFPRVLETQRPGWIAELGLEPTRAIPLPAESRDATFRLRVRELYLRMRAALSTSDLTTFGVWFDSLGKLLEGQSKPPRR